MSQYPKLTMTNSAIEMIAESQLSGTDLEITKVKIGDGLLLNDSDIQNMTDVVSARMEASVTSSKNDGNGQITITFAVGNERLDAGFFAREIGIFAKLTDGEEKLYAYTNAGNRCDWIPDKDTPIDSQIITATIVIGNAANVVVNIKDNAYALAIELADHEKDPNAHASMLDKHNSDDHAHPNRLRPPLKRSTTYAKGDIAFHDSFPSWAYLECTQAGTTSDNELNAGNAQEKDTITDGTTKWEVKRFGGGGTPVGTIIMYAANTIPDGYLLCDGSAVSRTDYAELFKVIGTTWGAGNGSTTFNLPNATGRFPEGASSVGSYKSAGLPNLTGNFLSHKSNNTNYLNGTLSSQKLFKAGDYSYRSTPWTAWTNETYGAVKVDFNASRADSTYGNSNTVQPASFTTRYLIKY